MLKNLKTLEKQIANLVYYFSIFFFCYTSFNKLFNLDSFRMNLIKTSVFNPETAFYISYFVIIIEILTVIILLLNKIKGLLVFCLFMLVFTLYISFLRFEGLYEVCGCGGVLNGLKYQYHLFINIFLILTSFYSFYIFKNAK